METLLGRKAKHKELYGGKEVFEIVGVTFTHVLLKGDFSGGTHNVEQESWMPFKGLMVQNMWGHFVDKDNEIDFTKNAGPRDL